MATEDEAAATTAGRPVRRRLHWPQSLRDWFNRITLRGRLALFTATAVALAVVLCAVSGWFVAQNQMIHQVDQTLKARIAANPRTLIQAVAQCNRPTPSATQNATTIVLSNGEYCPPGVDSTVRPTAKDVAIAASRTAGPEAVDGYRDGTTIGGTSVRVYTVSVGDLTNSDLSIAIAVYQPLGPVQDALAQLAWIMIGVSALVIAASAAGALLIARTALRPVDRLTEAAEHIARTQEPGVTIAVSGDDEIARLSTAFNAMSTALASSRDRQSQLIADAGHELRTPLTSLRTNVDLLVRSEETGRALPEATRTRMLGNMKAQMVELSTLIGDLLELSRPTRPKGSKPLAVLPLHDIAARALDRARLRGPGLVFNVDLRPWYVRADAHTMERAVINLLDNAVKFSPPGGAIDVSLKFGTLTVRDHGPGIPAEDLPHVFDRFWRSPSARQMPGSGLGLAIVAQTIREAGGEVSLAAAAPAADGSTGGALATVRLPGAPTPPPPTPPVPPAPVSNHEEPSSI
ncbi:sensor histidine kinase [Streptacidiphilus sp. EB129]|uniref:sensor histidine kinase n=1 Tax=Streptacidiphilus sp. EB129 TaxID=3156262 RepID=UPI00351383F6